MEARQGLEPRSTAAGGMSRIGEGRKAPCIKNCRKIFLTKLAKNQRDTASTQPPVFKGPGVQQRRHGDKIFRIVSHNVFAKLGRNAGHKAVTSPTHKIFFCFGGILLQHVGHEFIFHKKVVAAVVVQVGIVCPVDF